MNEKARSIIALWLRQTSGLHHRDHNAAINLRNDAVNKIKSTVGTIGTYDCGGQGSRARFSSDVDCSMKQEVRFVRMDKSNSLEFEARPPKGGRVVRPLMLCGAGENYEYGKSRCEEFA